MTKHIRIREPELQRLATEDFGLDLAVIGNGRTAALVNPVGRILWWCYPRFNSDPIFSRLLAGDEEKGFCDVVMADRVSYESDYLRNTAIVRTVLTDRHGNAVSITDFAPRFHQYDRVYRPPQLVRMIEPIHGRPRVTIRMRPTFEYGRPSTQRRLGSSHVSYQVQDGWIRLTTDAPLSYIEEETTFVLTRPICMVLGPDEPLQGDISTVCQEALDRTRDYWMEWVRRLSVAYDWQDAIIRAAIALKLSNFEETGGIVAALTTSIPEAPNSGRTWDYRFCWLRDAYFVVKALNRLGANKTMEDFISYILGAVAGETIQPVYSVVPSDSMEERIVPNLKGYRNDGPVRVGNAAVGQLQHDTFGSIILAAMPVFFDRRLPQRGDEELFRFLEPLGDKAVDYAFVPDAGIWEYRGRARVHTYSTAMCWAACSRLAAIARHLGLEDRAGYWAEKANTIQDTLLERAWNEKRGAFTGAFGEDDLDASVLLLPEIGLIDPEDPRFVSTLDAIQRELRRDKQMLRYANADDFGFPESAFLICRFWLIDALWWVGRREEAHDLFVDALNHRNRYGLLSEDIHPATGQLWGNFPQTYSMAGLILTAMRLSRTWEDRYWRG
jgi:GH15 family glucan-1,4-alpha-glucosidase